MGIGLDINFPLQELLRQVDDVKRRLVPRAAKIALARVGVTVRKQASISIREKLSIKAAVAKDSIKIRKEQGGLVLVVTASGKPIALKQYQARATKRGVSYKISKARGRRIYDNKYGKSFVIAKFGNNVFVRSGVDPPGPRKAKITKVFGPAVPHVFVTRSVRNKLEAIARRRFPLEFQRAIANIRA